MLRWVVALALTACLLEGGARLVLLFMGEAAPIEVGWERGEGRAARVRDLVYVPDAELFFRLAPGLRVEETGNPRIFDLHTNSRGLRGDEVELPKPAGIYRVLAVGDSCTFGSGAGQAQTWPAQLEQALARARPELRFDVINAGVPGFSSYQALRYLEVEGFALEPDVVVFTTAVNDASPATAGGKRRFGSGIMLSDREYAEAIRSNRQLGITRLLWRAGFGGAGGAALGVKRRVSLEEYQSNLRRFVAESEQRGILPVIVAWPLRSQAQLPPANSELEQTLGLYQQRAAQAGGVFVDFLEVLRGHEALYIDAVHLGPEGYGLVAERIAALLIARFSEQFQAGANSGEFFAETSSPAVRGRPHPRYRQQHPLPKRSGLHSQRSAARSRL